ncbi:MAG: hypothetical protein APF76_03625 [Desulfitibacter sp. BRH_c19]|nr:MAG: hypothetical protein APF76_03625 [Desulfitibacter sp. BRH_c19]
MNDISSIDREIKWNESDSEQFLQFGKALVPYREKMEKILIDLLFTYSQNEFTVVDICVGGGWLAESILKRYPKSKVIALDGCEKMLNYAKDRLTSCADRVTFKKFDIHKQSWEENLGKVDCFTSILAIHHLNDSEKEMLFKRLYSGLKRKGRFIIADIIKPVTEESRLIAAREWDEIVEEQSMSFYGDLRAYKFFEREQWNIFYYPDPVDKPSILASQLKWLKNAGFRNIEVLFYHAGHALFTGSK